MDSGRKEKWLLTGATGFVGRNLLLMALRQKRAAEIYVPVRNPDKLHDLWLAEGLGDLPSEVKVVRGEAGDWGEIPPDIDVAVHCAGILFARSEAEYEKTNVEGTLSLLKGLPASARVVVLSSQTAAGPCVSGMAARIESDAESPVTAYGRSKLEMERAVKERFSDRAIVFLRPPMVLGPRDHATLPLFKLARTGLWLKPGFGEKRYTYIAVDDLIEAIFKVCERTDWSGVSQRVFYVGSESPVTDKELIHAAGSVVGSRGLFVPIPQVLLKVASHFIDAIPPLRALVPTLTRDRASDIWPERWVISSESFRRDFDWRPRASLMETLHETVLWYRREGTL